MAAFQRTFRFQDPDTGVINAADFYFFTNGRTNREQRLAQTLADDTNVARAGNFLGCIYLRARAVHASQTKG